MLCPRLMGAVEVFKYVGKRFRGDAHPCILYRENDFSALLPQTQGDGSSFWSVFYRVIQKIANRPEEHPIITPYW